MIIDGTVEEVDLSETVRPTEEKKDFDFDDVVDEGGALDLSKLPKLSELNPIVINDEEDNPEYTLTFTRKIVVELDQDGYDPIRELFGPQGNGVGGHTLYGLMHLFHLSFRANHPKVGWDKANAIFDEIGVDREALQKKLLVLYFAAVQTLTEDTRKNGKRTVKL